MVWSCGAYGGREKQKMEARMEGRRGKRIPRVTSEDNIKEFARRRKRMGELKRMAKERDEMKKWIETDTTQ